MKKALETHTPQEMRIIAYNLITKISMCAAKALQHFHKYGIHHDIKSSNFVTFPKHNKNEEKLKEKENDSIEEIEDDQLECKIIDFNTSVLLPAEDAVAIKWYANGTRLYKAPEIRQTNLNENYNKQFYMTRAVDNWAFGLMIYGLWQNANRLYAEILGKENDYDLLDVQLEKIRFEKYETQLDQIIKACIQLKPENRPNMDSIVKLLQKSCDIFRYEQNIFEVKIQLDASEKFIDIHSTIRYLEGKIEEFNLNRKSINERELC
uniref:Protein kinase domain-containing protein n=1 Tax=Meloidogyne enterolobii TaxID=390850 RepID=A0A6V7UY48_MELEN|nr:unnamed protein product [Meloidogyne enterolobii]